LGTTGAIIGNWDPAAGSAPADLPAILTIHRADGTSEVVANTAVTPYSFHRSVVEYLNKKTPMHVTTAQSRDVVAIMQAAEESARANGRSVTPSLLR